MTQLDKIKKHLQINGSLTGMEAYNLYKARSLTKQISNLRKLGLNIASEWKIDMTGQRYVKYHFLGVA